MAFDKSNIRMAFNKSNVWHSTFKRVLVFILVCLLVNGFLFALVFRHWRIQEILDTLDSSHHSDFFVGHEQETEEEKSEATAAEKSTWEELVGSPAWLLIEETREAITAAGGVPRRSLSPDQRKAWNEAHPCEGRQELLRFWVRKKKSTPVSVTNDTTNPPANSEPSALLHVLFQEYTNLHRTCTHGGDMAYVTELYQSGNESSSPCKFLMVEFGLYGIGNRLLWLVSAYQYALLTKRVLVIDTRSTVDDLLCEPFPGSSWLLPDDFPYISEQRWPMPSDFQVAWDPWENQNRGLIVRNKTLNQENNLEHNGGMRSLDINDIEREKRETIASIRGKIQGRAYPERLSNMDNEAIQNSMGDVQRRLTEEETESSPGPHFHHAQANDGWAPNPRFFCDNEQEHLHTVKWVSLSKGCLYFLPDLFAVPSFQPTLEELFPNRDPLTHLLRQLTLPVNSIWKKVQDLYTKEFKSASRVVSMQVRYRNGAAMYRTLNSLVNKRISQCGSAHGLIPDPAAAQSAIPKSSWISSRGNHDGPVLIFIASLYEGLSQHLESVYDEAIKKGGKNSPVKLLQLSNLGFQSFDLEADHQAFLEIICLSLADELLTSPQSTYGQMAQAFGGLTPWLIDFSDEDNNSTCVRGQSTDACYQLPIDRFTCPYNKDVDGKEMAELAPYLKTCQDMTDELSEAQYRTFHHIDSAVEWDSGRASPSALGLCHHSTKTSRPDHLISFFRNSRHCFSRCVLLAGIYRYGHRFCFQMRFLLLSVIGMLSITAIIVITGCGENSLH